MIAAVFARFAACGSVRSTWLWLREEKLKWPLQPAAGATSPAPQVIWVEPTYHAVHTTLTHPAYAGAYVYGRSRTEKYVTPDGDLRTRRRWVGPGRVGGVHPRPSRGIPGLGNLSGEPGTDRRQYPPGRAPARHRGRAGGLRAAAGPGHLRGLRPQARRLLRRAAPQHPRLLLHRHRQPRRRQGACGTCGSAAWPSTPPSARRSWPPCAGDAPAACLAAARELEDGHDSALEQHRRQVDQARYDATKAERRYLAVDAENRLVARGLETRVGEGADRPGQRRGRTGPPRSSRNRNP